MHLHSMWVTKFDIYFMHIKTYVRYIIYIGNSLYLTIDKCREGTILNRALKFQIIKYIYPKEIFKNICSLY